MPGVSGQSLPFAQDGRLFGETNPCTSREALVAALADYAEGELTRGARLHQITRHVLGLYQQVPGARRFRRLLSENAHREGAGVDLLHAAVAEITLRAA